MSRSSPTHPARPPRPRRRARVAHLRIHLKRRSAAALSFLPRKQLMPSNAIESASAKQGSPWRTMLSSSRPPRALLSILRAYVSPLKLSLCGLGYRIYVSMICGTLALPCSSPKVYILKWFRNFWGMPPSRRRFKSTKRSSLVFRALLVDGDAEHLTSSRA